MHQKVILVGCSGAGKTSLAKTLVNNKPSCVHQDQRTIVLDTITWETITEGKSVCVSVIDFGGNEWYKIVHHLFIDENAVFLLVVNLATYSSESFRKDIASWLNVLLTRVPLADFTIIATHADKCTQEEILSKSSAIKSGVQRILDREGLKREEPPQVRVISSETMEGILDLKNALLGRICKNGKVIPHAWLAYYKKLQSPNAKEKPYFAFKDLLIIDSETARLRSILKFFHAVGTILWYHHSPELSKFVFHNPEYLTNLLKAIFTERLETESLRYIQNSAFQVHFTPDKFEEAKKDLLQQGEMSRDMLRCLWEHKKLDKEVFDAMIYLFMHLDFCYPLRTDEGGQVTSLRFPWFLTDTAPQDVDVQQILFGPPTVECHRLKLEYVFLTICPPPMYEKFAVRMHSDIPDTNSRIDWKDGVYATINQSVVLLHRTNRPTETVISLTVEGRDLGDLWDVLTTLDEEMMNVMSEWPAMRWDVWLVCSHCLQYGVRKACKFPGKRLIETYPEKCPYMTCVSEEGKANVPSCLVYPVKGKLQYKCQF